MHLKGIDDLDLESMEAMLKVTIWYKHSETYNRSQRIKRMIGILNLQDKYLEPKSESNK